MGAVRHGLLHRDREVMATGVNITVQPVGMSPSQQVTRTPVLFEWDARLHFVEPVEHHMQPDRLG